MSRDWSRVLPPIDDSQTQQIGDQVFFFLLGQFQLEHQVEEFHRVVQRRQAPVVQVGRRVLDASKRKRLDRSFWPTDIEPFDLQVMHVVVDKCRTIMALGTLGLAVEQRLAAQLCSLADSGISRISGSSFGAGG